MRRREFLKTSAAVYGSGQRENPASAQGDSAAHKTLPRQALLARALQGCDWLAGPAQVLEKADPYYGAIRSEYLPASGHWRFYQPDFQEPFWHTGQAVRALVLAHELSRNTKYLDAAVRGGQYMIHGQVLDRGDARHYGFLFERTAKGASTASQLEGLCALLDLYRATGDRKWRERFKLGLDWIVKNLYRDGEGRFTNNYLPAARQFAPPERSRPLIDDATLYLAWLEFKEPAYLRMFGEIAGRLLRDEDPPGNWIRYQPCRTDAFGGQGQIHPRQAWWWGYPMLAAYDAFQDEKYLKAAARTADWYIENSSLDGACYYHNTRNARHLSFDFCVSATGCAGVIYADLWKRTGQAKYRAAIEKTLGFLLRAQFGPSAGDPNLRGAFFEGLQPPDGTGRQQYYIRDISTTFAVRAMLEILRAFPDAQVGYQEF
ncbi:MAG: hypothetical protein ACE15B_02495 [Bryobacteraceae bacterium]